MTSDWRVLHGELVTCPWFSRVGQRIEPDDNPRIRRAGSWTEAIRWAGEDISWWCANEASNVLRESLHAHYNRQYQEWNHHIDSFSTALDDLMAGPVMTSLPLEACTLKVMNWIRYQLTGAYIESIYSSMSDVRLLREQVEWYLLGYFPCGWLVDAESGFPHRAVTVVY